MLLRYQPHGEISDGKLSTQKTKTGVRKDFIAHNSQEDNKRYGFGATKNLSGSVWNRAINNLIVLGLITIDNGIVCLNLAYGQNISKSECHQDLRQLTEFLGDEDGTALAVKFVQKIIYTKFVATHGESDDFKLYLESNDVFDQIVNMLSDHSFVEVVDAVYGIAQDRLQSKFRFDCAKNKN